MSVGVIILFIAIGSSIGNYGEGQKTTPSSLTTGDITAGGVPEELKTVFREASQKTGTPAALLAAIMTVECRSLIQPLSGRLVTLEKLSGWIQKDTDITEPPECAKNNGSNVFGPMQFQVGTTYLQDRGMKVYFTTKKGRPLKPVGTWEGYIQTVKNARGKEPSILNIRDSVYAAGFKLAGTKTALNKTAEFKDVNWNDEMITAVAIGYCHGHYGSDTRDDHITTGCKGGVLKGEKIGYGEGVLHHFQNYTKQQL